MFFIISACFCFCSIIFVLSPFWLAKNERIKINIVRQELEQLKLLKEETLSLWLADEKNYKNAKYTKVEWERRKIELKNRYMALSRQEIIYRDSLSFNL